MNAFLPFLRILVLVAVIAGGLQGIWSYSVDSEILPVTLSQFLGQGGHDYISLYYRLLFHTPLKTLYLFPFSNLQHMMAAKAVFAVNGIILSFLVYRVCKALTGNSVVSWMGLLFLISNPTWLSEFFRIRSDFLAMNFSLLALLVFLNPEKKDNFRKLNWILLLLGLSFLSTPKAILWNIPIGLFFILGGNWDLDRSKRKWFLSAAGILVLLVVSSFLISSSLQDAYKYAWKHFVEISRVYEPFGKNTWGLHWLFIWDSIVASAFHWAFIFLSWFLLPFLNLPMDQKKKRALLGSLWFFLCLFCFYTPKQTYLWAAIMPLLMIPFVFVLNWAFARTWEIFKVACLVSLTSIFTFWFFSLSRGQSGEETFQLIKDLDQFIGDRPLTVFDSMGLLPRTKNTMVYIGVGESWGLENAERALTRTPPDLVIKTDRIRVFWPQVQEKFLNENYLEVQEGIWLRKSTVDLPKQRITLVEKVPSLFNQKLLTRL